MSLDAVTLEKIIEEFKDGCALRSVLIADKSCPYSGPSKLCDTCHRDWMSLARKVSRLVEGRRTNVEKTERKLKVKVAELKVYKEFFGLAKDFSFEVSGSISKSLELFGNSINKLSENINVDNKEVIENE